MVADRINIHLVHGTFASKSQWWQQGSEFRRRLNHLIVTARPATEVQFFEVPWSGANSFAARQACMANIGKSIGTVKADTATTIVISHSHGGNILEDYIVSRRDGHGVDGCVFLATPFIHARFDSNAAPLERVRDLFVVQYLFLIIASVFLMIAWTEGKGIGMALAFILNIGLLVLIPVFTRLITNLLVDYQKWQIGLVSRNPTSAFYQDKSEKLHGVRSLVLGVRWDEAGLFFGWFYVLRRIFGASFEAGSRLMVSLASHGWFIILMQKIMFVVFMLIVSGNLYSYDSLVIAILALWVPNFVRPFVFGMVSAYIAICAFFDIWHSGNPHECILDF